MYTKDKTTYDKVRQYNSGVFYSFIHSEDKLSFQ